MAFGSAQLHCTTSPRVALALLDHQSESTMRDALKGCGVEPVLLSGDLCERLSEEKFEGCALPLDDSAIAIIETIRRSPLNRKIVIFGVLGADRPSPALLKFGINVILRAPLSKGEAVNRVQSTSALLIHELRRYIRIPLAVPVKVQDGFDMMTLMSREISGGGMSIETESRAVPTAEVQLSFSLPNNAAVKVMAKACWHANRVTGFRFEDADPGRLLAKQWIDAWLGIV
jgi:hypothetical protein